MFVIVILVEKVEFQNVSLGDQFIFIYSIIGSSHYETNFYYYYFF